jgi:hypothetical protein
MTGGMLLKVIPSHRSLSGSLLLVRGVNCLLFYTLWAPWCLPCNGPRNMEPSDMENLLKPWARINNSSFQVVFLSICYRKSDWYRSPVTSWMPLWTNSKVFPWKRGPIDSGYTLDENGLITNPKRSRLVSRGKKYKWPFERFSNLLLIIQKY